MNIEKIKARAEAATAETNVFYRINSLTPEDLEHSLNEDGYNTCLLKLMAHALFDIPALLDALEAKERENKALRNELCSRCGQYREAHNGACNGCKWRADNGTD